MRRRALQRRYGRSIGLAAELYSEAEAAFKRGRAALAVGDLADVRAQAVRVGELALKANRAGLDPNKYGKVLRAQRVLIDAIA
jgi:hypothetical protein